MKQAEITAKGDVQRVGYRDAVERIARQLDITGFVENLKPYDVRIVAEGEEDILDEFISQIRIKNFRFLSKTSISSPELQPASWGKNLGSVWMLQGRCFTGQWNLEKDQ